MDARGNLLVGKVIHTRMTVQVKRWNRNAQTSAVQQVRRNLGAHEQGFIITTSDFSVGAGKEVDKLDRPPVRLMNGEQLAALLAESGI